MTDHAHQPGYLLALRDLLRTIAAMKVKRCTTCKVEKSVDCFTRNRSQKDGFHMCCRACYQAHRTKPAPKGAT